MAKFANWSMAAAFFLVPAVSAVFGWLPCRADLAFLLILIFALGSGVLWQQLVERWGHQCDDVVATCTYFSLIISLAMTVVMTPLFVLFSSWGWLTITLIGMAVILCAEVMSFLQLRYGHCN